MYSVVHLLQTLLEGALVNLCYGVSVSHASRITEHEHVPNVYDTL